MRGIRARRRAAEEADHRHCLLLGAQRGRRRHRTSQQQHELASVHYSITSSARTRIDGGTVRPTIAMGNVGVPGAESWRAGQFGGPGVRPGELAKLWRAAGLRDVREGQITIRMDFSNFADYWEPAIQGPLLPGLLHGLSPDWHERVRSSCGESFP